MPGDAPKFSKGGLLKQPEIHLQVRAFAPSPLIGLVAAISHFSPQGWIGAQSFHRGQQLVVAPIEKASLAFFNDFRETAQIASNHRCSLQVPLNNDDPEDFVARGRDEQRDRMPVEIPESLLREWTQEVYVRHAFRLLSELAL